MQEESEGNGTEDWRLPAMGIEAVHLNHLAIRSTDLILF